jgi:riboflavin biosynthesis pyrimidine reductase
MVKRWDKKYLNVIKARIIVVSRKKHDDKNCIYVKDPKSAVSMAKRLGFKSAILSGGPTLNNSFIKKGLVDDMLLNVEPIAINGKNLFNDEHIMNKLIFVGVKRINNKVLQLHYKVK